MPAQQPPERLKIHLPGGFHLPRFGINQLLALVIVSVSLWALGVMWLAMQAAEQWVGSWQQEIVFHVYLSPEREQQQQQLSEALVAMPGVLSTAVIDRSQAATWMKNWLGASALNLDELAQRLPFTVEVVSASQADQFLFEDIREVAERFGAEVNVSEANLLNVKRWLHDMRKLTWFAVALLAMAMAIIISNTLRMMLLANAEELRLMRLMGAKEWFVRMPYLLEGVLIGTMAALASWLLLYPLTFFVEVWLVSFSANLSPLALLPTLLLCGSVVGGVGAAIATSMLGSE
ncbi:MAG: FtsX-like permease family protein [Mariprofundaceae bacterium]